MFDTVFGLPVHVLILHATVIVVPAAALATAAVAVRPAWLPRFGWWVVGLDAVMLAVVYVTRESGKKLVNRLFPDPASRSDAVNTHVQRGLDMLWYALALFLVALVLVLVARLVSGPRNTSAGVRTGATGGPGAQASPGGATRSLPAFALPVVAVLAVAAAVLATVQVVRVGHSGSSAVWKDVVKSTNSSSATR
ncbi:MAG: hypothetical protein HOV68_05745 [Streptomycetaceae bacterium]|nr:hypothetical protein [Streptomycetaceae bacterium]